MLILFCTIENVLYIDKFVLLFGLNCFVLCRLPDL